MRLAARVLRAASMSGRRSERAPEAVEPGVGPLDDPVVGRFLPALNPVSGNPRRDPPSPAFATTPRCVVGLVGAELVLTPARLPPSPAAQGRDCIEGEGYSIALSWRLAPVIVRPSGVPRASTTRWRLVPSLLRSVGFGPVAEPLFWPGLTRLSRLARLPSICPAACTRSRSTPCRWTQIPAASRSRRRRQQLLPEPQPTSAGSLFPGNARTQHGQDAAHGSAVLDEGTPTLWTRPRGWERGGQSRHRDRREEEVGPCRTSACRSTKGRFVESSR